MKKNDIKYPVYTTVSIALSGTTSAEVDIGNRTIVGIITPSTFDGTTMTFTAAPAAGGTHYAIAASNAASTAYTVTTTASIFTPIAEGVTKGARFIKIVCGSSQTTTGTDLILVTRNID